MAFYEQPAFVRSPCFRSAGSNKVWVVAYLVTDWPVEDDTYRVKTSMPLCGQWSEIRETSEWAWLTSVYVNLATIWPELFNKLDLDIEGGCDIPAKIVSLEFRTLDGKKLDTRPLDKQLMLNKLTARKAT